MEGENKSNKKKITSYLTKPETTHKNLIVGKPILEKKNKRHYLHPTKTHTIPSCVNSCSYASIFVLINKPFMYGP